MNSKINRTRVTLGVSALLGLGLLTATVAPATAAPVRYGVAQNQTPRGDWDRDGIVNARDNDDDNDGVADRRDKTPFSTLSKRDKDGDGIRNRFDRDKDGDGLRNGKDDHPNNPNRR